MTAPKRPVPNQFVELTRRTSHRAFFLRPGRETRELMGYFYGKSILDCIQRPCVASALANHLHIGQVDPECMRSAFMQQFFSNVARKRNIQLNRRENLWSSGAPGDMVALELNDVIERILYICLQPVAAGLVERVGDWTGFQILPRDWGKPMRFKRPKECGKTMPEFVEFTPMPPPGFEGKPLQQVIRFFEALIRREENSYKRARKGSPVRGIAVCESVNPFATPRSRAPIGGLNPRFTSKNKQRAAAALRCQRKFRQAYRARLEEFRNGNRQAVFPAGTLQMVHLAGVKRYPYVPNDPQATSLRWTGDIAARWDSVFAA